MAEKLNKDLVYRTAKPKEKDYSINDGSGLALHINAKGSKLWRFVYTFEGKRYKIAFGNYPATSLESARQQATIARENINSGINPADKRKAVKQTIQQNQQNTDRIKAGLPVLGSFADVAQQWLKSLEHLTKPQTHIKKVSRIKTHAFPTLANKSITEIKSFEILAALKPLIDKQQLETAHRLHAEITSIFDYAIVHNLAEFNPAHPVAKQIPAHKVKHNAAIIDPKLVGKLLRDIQNYHGTFIVRMAFRLSPLLFQRLGEIRQMLWDDIDLEAKEWRPIVSKVDFHHIVPLSTQVVEILEAIKPLTGNQQYIFPCRDDNGKSMSDGAIRSALRRLGYDKETMSAHGFRTVASTLLNEQGWSADAIERQLAHAPRDAVRAAYNRAQYLDERRRMMQSWADYLDSLKAGATVLPFKHKAG